LKLLDTEDEHKLKEVAEFCIANDMKEEGLALYEVKHRESYSKMDAKTLPCY
jgi:hypothetical protein